MIRVTIAIRMCCAGIKFGLFPFGGGNLSSH
jgi:hypothetical protein